MISLLRLSVASAALVIVTGTLARAQDIDTASVETLIRLLRSPAPKVRLQAALELPERGADAARAIPALREMAVHDNDAYARSKAVQALGEMGPAACSVLPTLIPLVRHPDPEIRASTIEALGGIGLGCGDASEDSAIAFAAAKALNDPVSFVRFFALRTLDRLHQTSSLVGALRSRDDKIAENAARLLALYEPTDIVVDGLLAALADPRPAVRLQAAYSLGGFGSPVRAALVKAAADSASPRAAGAREAIRYLDHVTAAPVYGRCYQLAMTRWMPEMGLQDDTIFSTPPHRVRFTGVRMDERSNAPNSFRVEPLREPYSVHGPGEWSYRGDSLYITWSTGYSGLHMRLRVASDTLTGNASTFWDFTRATQAADVRGIPIECGDISRPPAQR